VKYFELGFAVDKKAMFRKGQGKTALAIPKEPFHAFKPKHPVHEQPVDIRAWSFRINGKGMAGGKGRSVVFVCGTHETRGYAVDSKQNGFKYGKQYEYFFSPYPFPQRKNDTQSSDGDKRAYPIPERCDKSDASQRFMQWMYRQNEYPQGYSKERRLGSAFKNSVRRKGMVFFYSIERCAGGGGYKKSLYMEKSKKKKQTKQ
jgi:hypothetical protein